MPDLSPFQTLPIHIAEAIGYYCVGLQRHRTKNVFRIKEKSESAWRVLHDVSRSWMQLARKNLNKSVYLRLSKDPECNKFTTSPHAGRVIEQGTGFIRDVKDVYIYFHDIVVEPNEEELEKLGRVWPEDLVFPKARSLNCYLGIRSTQASDSARTVEYFRWFMERVRSLFPNLRETTIEFGQGGLMTISTGVLFSKDWDASLFISALFKRSAVWGTDEGLNPAHMGTEHILIKYAPELTSYCYSRKHNSEFSSWIIKRSAQTLEKLYHDWSGGGGFKEFMFDDDGQVIVYPRLKYLHVFDLSDDHGSRTTHKSIVPFPALQHFRVFSSCIFEDDTLFRGSNDTLTSLDIGLHRGFVDIFRKYKVFSQGAYPNILYITLSLANRPGLTLRTDEFVEAAFGLVTPSTQSMTINGEISYQHISTVIPTCAYLENIQILLLKYAKLRLLEILDIVKYFPHVADFGCRFRGIDSELDAIQDKAIPSYLGTQYAELVSRLKCWHVYSLEGASDTDMAVMLVTLAVLCPNFTFVTGWRYDIDTNDCKIGYILSSGLYGQHAKRIRLLFNSR